MLIKNCEVVDTKVLNVEFGRSFSYHNIDLPVWVCVFVRIFIEDSVSLHITVLPSSKENVWYVIATKGMEAFVIYFLFNYAILVCLYKWQC